MAVNAQKRRRGLIAVVAALIAAGAFVFALTLHDSGTGAPASGTGAQATPAPTVPVVVALSEIKPGDVLTSTNLGVQPRPVSTLPTAAKDAAPVYYQDIVSLTATPHYASIGLASGTVLQTSMTATSTAAAKPVVAGVIDLKAGDVALSIPYDVSKGAGGYIQTEDRIDIIINDAGVDPKLTTSTIRYAFQDVRVIHAGSKAEAGTGTGSLLLIELSRAKAASLTYLMDHGAGIRYFIRPRDTYTKGPQPGSGPVDGTNWPAFLDG